MEKRSRNTLIIVIIIISSDKCTWCHTEIEVEDQTFYLTQTRYTDTWPTSLSADPKTAGPWQGSHWNDWT